MTLSQDQMDRLAASGTDLLAPEMAKREAATSALQKHLADAWAEHRPKTGVPEIMPVFRITIVPQLAAAIRSEPERKVLVGMLHLASEIGEPDAVMTESLIHRMKDDSIHGVGDESIVGVTVIDALCQMGVPARLLAVKNSRGMDLMARMGAVASLTVGGLSQAEPIHEPVLALLSESSEPEDWNCLCELSVIFRDRVPRNALRAAFVKLWRQADGVLKQNFAYTLRRYGFTRIGPWWI